MIKSGVIKWAASDEQGGRLTADWIFVDAY